MNYLTTQKFKSNLEHIIDSIGLEQTIELLQTICNEKAEHIQESYNDNKLATSWEKAAKSLGKSKSYFKG